MNLRNSRGALLALGVGAALVAGLVPIASGAQTPPRQLPADPQPGFERGDARGFDRREDRSADRLERRLDFLHSELRITAAQEQLWAEFADVVRRDADMERGQFRDRRDEFRGGPDGRSAPPSIVERMERRQQGLEERSERHVRLLSALQPLYAALNEDQRRAADENLFAAGREDRGRRGPRRLGQDPGGYGFDGPFYRPFGPLARPFGPLDQYNRYDR